MTPRDNLLRLYRREGYDVAPVGMNLCPALVEEFERHYPGRRDYLAAFGAPYRIVYDPGFAWNFDEVWRIPDRGVDWHRFYPKGFQYAVRFDGWGVAHEDNPHSQHMTRMHHPLDRCASVDELAAYPWPDFAAMDFSYLQPTVDAHHANGLAVFVWAECTVFETAWYLRGMDHLLVDMMTADPKATWLLDHLTELACLRARHFAAAGADILGLGDDIGMQHTTLMSVPMYRQWLKPRLVRVIAAAKAVKPDLLVSYHSCGHVTPFIGDLIEAGIDILNPVQPECMDFAEIHAAFGDRLSFNGTLGTQSLFPNGTPGDIRDAVFRNLEIAGRKGGLFCCPTHMLEPEVPWANVQAYVDAIAEFNDRPAACGR